MGVNAIETEDCYLRLDKALADFFAYLESQVAEMCIRDSYYTIGEDTGEAGMGMGADFDDDDYANEYDDDEEEGRRQVVQDWHQLVTCISDKVEEHNPLIGREQELDRTIQVLCRAEKNNPLHIGEAGVGKTALVYGLAKLINENQVPERLKGARIYGCLLYTS